MIDIAVLRAMVAEGASAETIVRVVEVMTERDRERRKQWAESQQRTRARRAERVAKIQPSQQTVNRQSTDPPQHILPPLKNSEPKKVLRSIPKTSLPDDFEPDLKTSLHASAARISEGDYAREIERFKDSARAHGRRYADWQSALRNWLDNFVSGKFTNGGSGHGRYVEKTNGRGHSVLDALDDLFGPKAGSDPPSDRANILSLPKR